MGRQRQFQIYKNFEEMLKWNNGINEEIGNHKMQGIGIRQEGSEGKNQGKSCAASLGNYQIVLEYKHGEN